ncbi:Hypothetical protein NCS54_00762400 [Fusarium falciforme]|uniref:Hypothetical protein n=1 Tax=Fusarium falciforme TaxID=195108 RepID=UPI002300E690|nr:Hypothetical protein NCS54_00762400 [Fusarium falciforme]WAO90205.1 Hypothetical protein NCS54_00762400 [Fusarium falciforme]
MTKAMLRAKTGCFTCRKRKVKCGEEKPSCRNCSAFGRQCAWPTSTDLCDRRHRSRASPDLSFAGPSPSSSSSASEESKSPDSSRTAIVPYRGRSPSPGRSFFKSGIESELIHHLLNYYFSVIVLPTSSQEHVRRSRSELVDMMLHYPSVRDAVFACCACNKHVLLNDNRHKNAALHYYSKAVHELNQMLAKFQPMGKQPDSSLLTTVVFLYVHDLWSLDGSADPRNHVAGAVTLLDLVSKHGASPGSMTQGFDRIIAESILYQAFLLSTRRPFAPYFHIDPQFVTNVERLLAPPDSQDASYAACSPVLGIPTTLYRLKLGIINFHNAPAQQSPEGLARLRSEMDYWVALVVPRATPHLTSASAAHTFDLVILATSLLLDLVTECFTYQLPIDLLSLLNTNNSPRWQVESCLEILRQPQEVEKWTRMFLGLWPLLILGYAVNSDEDMALIQGILGQMRERLGYGEVQRIQQELEEVQDSRNYQALGINSNISV